jgi:hypothetical protein
MFKYLKLKDNSEKAPTYSRNLVTDWLDEDSDIPITLKQINNLPRNFKKRVYRNLLSPGLLSRFGIHPITWKGSDGQERVGLTAEPGTNVVHLWAQSSNDPEDEFFRLEMADNIFNGIDLHLLLLNDPNSPKFETEIDEAGNPTLFSTARRNISEERRAKQAGLAPAQIRNNLGASSLVIEQIDVFMATLGQQAYFLEPLTYASAWVFERRGFAYVRGHQLMEQIHQEFQPGGKLRTTLDGSSPFRQSNQCCSVRGRAWAIHDGILDAIDARWDNIRMIKQVGRHAGVITYPEATY